MGKGVGVFNAEGGVFFLEGLVATTPVVDFGGGGGFDEFFGGAVFGREEGALVNDVFKRVVGVVDDDAIVGAGREGGKTFV